MLFVIPLAISAGLSLLSRLFTPKPKSPAAPAQYTLPDASNAVPIPYLAGTYAISPNICFYGGYHVGSHTSGSKSSKHTTQVGYLTHMDVLCMGQVDALLQIQADDVVIFQGPDGGLLRGGDDATDISTTLGTVRFYWGTPTQTSDGYLASHGFPTSSGFRNVCYAVFKDCQLNASFQVQRLVFVVKRVPATGLSGTIEVSGGINPAHVLYDVLTSSSAGSRYSAADLDLDAFNTIAVTLATAVGFSWSDSFGSLVDGRYQNTLPANEAAFNSLPDGLVYYDYYISSHKATGHYSGSGSVGAPETPRLLIKQNQSDTVTIKLNWTVGTKVSGPPGNDYLIVWMGNDPFSGDGFNIPRGTSGARYRYFFVFLGSGAHAGHAGIYAEFGNDNGTEVDSTTYPFTAWAPGDTIAVQITFSPASISVTLNTETTVINTPVGRGPYTNLTAWQRILSIRAEFMAINAANTAAKFSQVRVTTSAPGVGANVVYAGTSMKDVLGAFMAEFDMALRVRNGKISPVLIRDDYDPAGLPAIYEGNSDQLKRRREPFGTASNDVQFTYVNAARAWRQDPIEMFNLGSLAALSRRQTSTMGITLVTDLAGASSVAARKMRQLNTAADTFSAHAQPALGCLLEIGDPVNVVSTRLGIDHMACRVIDLQETTERGYEVSLQEDVYRIGDSAFLSDSGTVPRIDALAKPIRQLIIEAPWDMAGESLQLAFLYGRGSRAALAAYVYESADNAEYSEVLTQTAYAVTGVLVGAYAATIKIDRTVGFTFDADNADVLGLASQSEDQFLRHESLAIINGEILAIKTLTPIAGGISTGGRWKVTGVIRGLMDTDTANHLNGSVVYFVGSQETLGSDAIIRVGAGVYLKATPFSSSATMDLVDVDAAGPFTVAGRAFAPLPVENMRANGVSFIPTYSGGDITITWDYRVRGAGAGVGVPAAGMLFTPSPHEGVFVIDVAQAGGPVVRSLEINSDDTAGTGWTYTTAMNTADNGTPTLPLEFRIRNRSGAYYSLLRSILVRHV